MGNYCPRYLKTDKEKPSPESARFVDYDRGGIMGKVLTGTVGVPIERGTRCSALQDDRGIVSIATRQAMACCRGQYRSCEIFNPDAQISPSDQDDAQFDKQPGQQVESSCGTHDPWGLGYWPEEEESDWYYSDYSGNTDHSRSVGSGGGTHSFEGEW